MKQNFAVLGAGNGGQVIAAYLKLKGKHVTLFDRFPQVLEPIRARGGIQLEGVAETGFAKLDLICEDVAQAVKGAEVIFVVLPAFAHAYVAEQLAGCMEDGQTVIVCPGARISQAPFAMGSTNEDTMAPLATPPESNAMPVNIDGQNIIKISATA